MWGYCKIWPVWVSLCKNIPLQSRNPANTLRASGVAGAATPSGMLSIFLEEIEEFREEWQKWLGGLRSLMAYTQADKNRCVCESERNKMNLFRIVNKICRMSEKFVLHHMYWKKSQGNLFWFIALWNYSLGKSKNLHWKCFFNAFNPDFTTGFCRAAK